MVGRQDVMAALGELYDPCCAERGISLVDMGLIEQVEVTGSNVRVDMVLTSGWCPSVAVMNQMITEGVMTIDGVESVDVEVVFDPVWTPDRLSPDARAKLAMPMEQLIPYREARLATTTPVEVSR